ncbi:hypothetical protein BrE312_3983 [Brenneria sp. EniD312]|nr:hypothetical protein BrE312_3983 [Brenneria sp. EniD312]
MAVKNIVAVDLGASSRRVMPATFQTTRQHLALKEIHSFSNQLILQDNYYVWELPALEQAILTGLHRFHRGTYRPRFGVTPMAASCAWRRKTRRHCRDEQEKQPCCVKPL